MKVALFVTCLVDQLFPNVGMSMVRILERLGCEVEFIEQQTCCGQPAFNSGYVAEARASARTLLDAFEASEFVVSPSGSCASMVRHFYAELFRDDPIDSERAHRLVRKTYELSQFLVKVLGVTELGAELEARATFHPSCHGTRLLGIADEPELLLGAVRGLELVPLPRCQDCCGFGGTFAVKMAEVSTAMVQEKVDHVVESGARLLIGTDMGCLMNIAGHVARRHLPIVTMHLAEVLDSRATTAK